MEEKIYISKSRFGRYLFCPYSYKLAYIDRIETEPSFYAEIGTEFHKFCENFWKTTKIVNGDLKIQIKPTNYLMENFVMFQLNRWKQLKMKSLEEYFFPIQVEKMLYDKEGIIRGIPDAIFRTPDKKFIVVDYKTSRSIMEKTILEHSLDFIFYDILVKDNFGDIKYNLLYYPNSNSIYKIFPFSEKVLNKWREKIRLVKNCIEKQIFPKKKTHFCEWCEYKDFCKQNDNSNNR